MFIGHYSTAFAARGRQPALPLWHLFIAAQLVDFGWAILVLLGIEKVRIVPHFMEASMLDLYFMPYTHSLPGSLAWALGAGLIYALLWKGPKRVSAGVLFGAVVLSHWFLDLLVHAPDLELFPGGPKLGFGLWSSLVWSQLVEFGLLIAGFIVYLVMTKPKGRAGHWAPFALLIFMLALQAYNHLPVAVPPTPTVMSTMALMAYSCLVAFAWLVDRTRGQRSAPLPR